MTNLIKRYYLPNGDEICSKSDLISPRNTEHEVSNILVYNEPSQVVMISINNPEQMLSLSEMTGWTVKAYNRFQNTLGNC